jgi:hypothetical protein
MDKYVFPDNYEDLYGICSFLYSITQVFSEELGVDFNLSKEEFASVIPDAVTDQHFYYVDYHIEPNGYDTTKFVAFMALKLIQTFPDRFKSEPLFYGYICHLQETHPLSATNSSFLEKQLPNIKKLCNNLHAFCTNFRTAVPSYAFLKGLQYSLRVTK